MGSSLWSLGSGWAPPGPPAPGRLHRSISWAGTVHHASHCSAPSETTCGGFLLTCTNRWSSSTNQRCFYSPLHPEAEAEALKTNQHTGFKPPVTIPELADANLASHQEVEQLAATCSARWSANRGAADTFPVSQGENEISLVFHLCARPSCMNLVQVSNVVPERSAVNPQR